MKKAFGSLIRKLAAERNRFEYLLGRKHRLLPWESKFLSVGIISDTWQAWNAFCRSIVIDSCIGTRTRSGSSVSPRNQDNRESRVGYELKHLGRGRRPSASGVLTGRYAEPTWGDVGLLTRAIPQMGVANSSQLVSAFGVSLIGPRHLQTVRNACFHTNSETVSQVMSLSLWYTGGKIGHPYEIAYREVSGTSTTAMFQWLQDLEEIAIIATT